MKMDIQRAAELLAARSAKEFGDVLKKNGDPFKDFINPCPFAFWMPCFPSVSGIPRS